MKFIDFKNQKIAYSSSKSEGTPLIFLHGFCEDSTMWEDFTSKWKKKYQVIKIDLPGHGESEISEELSIKEMGKAVIKVIKKLKVEKFILIGHSMGGYVSLEIAKKHADKLLGLGLFHSHPFEDSEEKKKGRYKSIEFINTHGHMLFAKKLLPMLFKNGFQNSNSHLLNKMVFRASRFPTEGFKNALRAMAERKDNTKILKEINCPILMIIGKLDQTLGSKTMIKQTTLPTLTDVHVLEKVGHMGMFSAERETQRIVDSFVKFCTEE